MGAYNTLQTDILCENCTLQFHVTIQFKFGSTGLFTYKLGDRVRWSGNDIGKPGMAYSQVYGILEDRTCPYCGYENKDEYDIIIEYDIIKRISPINNSNDYLTGDGNYLT